mgnify:CR=1 FL=1|tara:strand:- start:2559 stop:2792 length:234 start_codon:yes stop_codon:yes gene_type:complete
MSNLSKRSTIYFEPNIHQALKLKAASSHLSVSELVDEAVRLLMSEDQEDLAAFSDREREKEISYEALLNDLKKHGKI